MTSRAASGPRAPRGATTGTPGWLVRLLVLLVAVQTSVQLARPVTSYRALALEGGALEIGYITAAFAILPLVLAVPLGRVIDRSRPGPFLAAAAALVAAAGVLLGCTDDVLGLVAGNAVLGLGNLCLMVPAQALIARRSPDARHDRDYGLFAAAVAISQMLGPALAGVILSATDDPVTATTWAFIGSAGVAAVALPGCWRLDAPPAATGARAEPPQRRTTTAGVLRIPGVPSGVLASVTLIAAIDVLIAYLPVIGEQRGIGPGAIGLLLSLRAATSVLSRLVLARLAARWSRPGLIATSAAASGLALALVAAPLGVWPLAVVMALLGLVAGVGQPLTMSHLVALTPATARGTVLGLRFTGNRAGQAVIPLAAGAVAAGAGVSVSFLMLSGMLGACAVLLGRGREAPLD